MSVEVLQRKMIIHEARHDLESFYWLLLWLVLRHTCHSDADPHGRLKKLFDQATEEECADTKKVWLMRDAKHFKVYDNAPLSDLLKKFAELCNANSDIDPPLKTPSPLKHKRVLDLFDSVLGRADWPAGDRAILFKPEDDPEQVHEARPRTTWTSTHQGVLPGMRQGGVNAAPRNSRSLIQDDYLSATISNMLPIAGGSHAVDAEPHTPRTVSSASEVPGVEKQYARRYMSDPNAPSPSLRGQMRPPPIPHRSQLPFTRSNSARAASDGPSNLPSRSAGRAASIPPPTHIRSWSSGAVQPPRRTVSSQSKRSERRKRSHEEYTMDAGEPREQSSSKRTRTHSGTVAALPSTHGMVLRKRSKSQTQR